MFEQNSDSWFQAKCGLLTASEFSEVMKKARNKSDEFSASFRSLLYKKCTEAMTGQIKQISAKPLDYGIENEPGAILAYEFINEVEVDRVPIIIDKDNNLIGASPDGLIDKDGMIEVKTAFNPQKQIERFFDTKVPAEYLPQIQGNLMVNEREWCDFISYCPAIENENRIIIRRVYRDDNYIAKLRSRTSYFTMTLEGALYELGIQDYKRRKIDQLKGLGLL
jgi:exodeoxyribonuclease (lambda-induced)